MARLTAVKVKALVDPGRYGDGDGLWLQVARGGSKSWLFRYARDGRERQMGIGSARHVTLARARELAREQRQLLLDDVDPLDHRRQQRQAKRAGQASATTFRGAAERFIAAHEAGWRNQKHRDQWRATLATYAYPVLGELPVAAVDTDLVLLVLEPVWTSKPETASRLRGRIEAVLAWATVRKLRLGDNPARWRGHLDQLLPARAKVRRVRHHAALPYAEVPAFLVELRQQPGLAARALEFTILTACRTGEVLGARWEEVDLERALWTVPAPRMKGGLEHRVPLAPAAVALLEALPRLDRGEYLFPGARAGSRSATCR